MNVLQVKENDPLMKEYPDLEVEPISAAIMQIKSGDKVMVPNGVWLTSPLSLHDVSLTIAGKSVQQSIIRIPDDQDFLELAQNVRLTISNCTIVVGDRSRLMFLTDAYSGMVRLKNVTVLFENEFDSMSEFYPIIESAPVISKKRRTIEFERCKIPYVMIYATKIKARYAVIGDIIKPESFLHFSQNSLFKDCWLHHVKLAYQPENIDSRIFTQLQVIKTNGGLSLQGDMKMHSLEIIPYQSNYKEKLDQMQALKGIRVQIDHDLYTLDTLLSLHHREFPSFALNLEPFNEATMQFYFEGRLGLEYDAPLAFMNMKNCQCYFLDTTIPSFKEKSLLENGEISMTRTVDDNAWKTNQTVINLTESDSTLIKTIHEQTGFTDAGIQPVTVTNEKSIHHSALGELDAMIGLKLAKETIRQMVAVAKLNAERIRRGLDATKGLSLHTVFLGNAGVGKTTVARLYAKALYENGLLSKNTVKEVTSKDLIASYVGQTRPLVHQVVMDSLDGVLFIDEAYSLGRKDDEFANQAVDQLIADMENYRDRLVVILAGYTDEMKEMLATANPGLRSRFTNMVMFEDYSEAELLQIMQFHLQKMRARPISKETLGLARKGLIYLHRLLGENKQNAGNGRFVRNYVQAILIARDNRLAKQDLLSIQDDSLLDFTENDVKLAVMHQKQQIQFAKSGANKKNT